MSKNILEARNGNCLKTRIYKMIISLDVRAVALGVSPVMTSFF